MFNYFTDLLQIPNRTLTDQDFTEWAKRADLSFDTLLDKELKIKDAGLSGLLAYAALLNFLSHYKSDSIAVIKYVERIKSECLRALDILRTKGKDANIKPIINDLFKFGSSANITDLTGDKYAAFTNDFNKEWSGKKIVTFEADQKDGYMRLVLDKAVVAWLKKYNDISKVYTGNQPLARDGNMHITLIVPRNLEKFDVQEALVAVKEISGQKFTIEAIIPYTVNPQTDSRMLAVNCLQIKVKDMDSIKTEIPKANQSLIPKNGDSTLKDLKKEGDFATFVRILLGYKVSDERLHITLANEGRVPANIGGLDCISEIGMYTHVLNMIKEMQTKPQQQSTCSSSSSTR